LTPELVFDRLTLLDESLRGFGFGAPRLALAGINPHASEGGLFGDDEVRVLGPALERARAAGIDVAGPEPPDTVFVRAQAGAFDGVLALYHDQGFIPVKLAAPTTGLTVLLGMPYLRVSPAHGTAFDIAGRGIASPENLIAALLQAAAWCGKGV
jgi:4-hydroxy-L-threonine phosphate dehydrogenase PdxA